MVSQTNINGAFTCALVKDRDMGNFMGEKKKKRRREIPVLQSTALKKTNHII